MDCFNVTTLTRNASTDTTTPDTTPDTTTPDTTTTTTRMSETTKYYIMDIAVPCVCALGILGNLLTLTVLTTEKLHRTLSKMETSAHIGLIALAVSDFLFCLLVFIFTQVYLKQFYEVGDTMIYFDLLANGLITMFIISSTWLIVVMAAERYIAVCHPFRARKILSLRRTRASIMAVFVVCALSTIAIFMERKIVKVVCDDGRDVYKLEERNQQSVKLRRILWAIFFDFIPCAALIYFNLCLILQIRQAKKLRDRMTPKHSIIRYTSSCNRNSIQLLNPSNNSTFNSDIKPTHTTNNSSCTEVTASKESNSRDLGHKHNGIKKYSKFNVYYNTREKNSQSNAASTSQCTNSQFNILKDNRIGSATGNCSTSSTKIVPNKSVTKRRPSDGARNSVTRRRTSDGALNSVTATLVAIVLLFLVLVSPSELMKFSVAYTQTDMEYKLIVIYVTNFMQVLNFSLNFLLYCAVNKTFRHTLHGLLCCCWLVFQD